MRRTLGIIQTSNSVDVTWAHELAKSLSKGDKIMMLRNIPVARAD